MDDIGAWLNEMQDQLNTSLVGQNRAIMNNERMAMWNNGLSNGLGVLNGLAGIAGIASNAARINDTPWFDNQLAGLQRAGTYGYTDYGQVINEMNNLSHVNKQNYDDVRGMTKGQKWGSVGTGLATGASAGAAFGPWGALVGGVIGAAGAGLGVLKGNKAAEVKVASDNMDLSMANRNAMKNYSAALDGISEKNHIQGMVHPVAYGGPIKRQMDMNEYKTKVLGNRPVKQYCKGGLKVRLKVK